MEQRPPYDVKLLTVLLEKAQEVFDRLKMDVTPPVGMPASIPQPHLTTPTGKIRGLHERIVSILKERGEPMSSRELTKAIYDPGLGITIDALSRRVIVATSSLHKDHGRLVKYRAGNGETLWYPKEFADNNHAEYYQPNVSLEMSVDRASVLVSRHSLNEEERRVFKMTKAALSDGPDQ